MPPDLIHARELVKARHERRSHARPPPLMASRRIGSLLTFAPAAPTLEDHALDLRVVQDRFHVVVQTQRETVMDQDPPAQNVLRFSLDIVDQFITRSFLPTSVGVLVL